MSAQERRKLGEELVSDVRDGVGGVFVGAEGADRAREAGDGAPFLYARKVVEAAIAK